MSQLCSLISHTPVSPLLLLPQHNLSTSIACPIKDYQPLLSIYGGTMEASKSQLPTTLLHILDDANENQSGFHQHYHQILVDYLISSERERERERERGFQFSFSSDLVFPSNHDFHREEDFFRDFLGTSNLTFPPHGPATAEQIQDFISILSEFHFSYNNSFNSTKNSILVPTYEYHRFNGSGVAGHAHASSLKLHATTTTAPVNSPVPDTIKIKPSPKRRNNKKAGHDRDLYKKNYFHACENLLSFMVNKNRQRKRAILSLKNSGPELPHLLTQFSAAIAGTGIALLFSVMSKVACGSVPFCPSKLLNTGLGFGLVWLSCSVYKLRDTIMYIRKKAGLKEDEMMKRVDRSINQIFFRAATLMTLAILRIG